MTGVSATGTTLNSTTLIAGSCTDGVYSGSRYSLAKEVTLFHDRPWSIEWQSEGAWTGGSLFFASTRYSRVDHASYIFRSSNSSVVAMGIYQGGKFHNYGLMLSDYGIDGTVSHIYKMVNEISADGSNMVYLYVDGVKLGAMNNYFLGGTAQGTTSNWISGKDFTFSYMGTVQHPLNSCSIGYIQINEGCMHTYNSVVVAPTCTENGYTVHTCTGCGDSYIGDVVAATGHTWVDATCTTAKTCSGCGQTEGEPLDHTYVITVKPATCTMGGYTTHTCTGCGRSYISNGTDATGHTWVDATCTEAKTCSICGQTEGEALGHSYEAVVTAPTCTMGGYTTYTCSNCGNAYTADATAATGHNYVGGTCTVCGATDDAYAPGYYLVGYINGANYGCEDDYANLGEYKFVDGTLTATFTKESYVFIKTGDNANWYMAESYITDNTGTFKNTSTGTSEKMLVPGGVEVTFTLVVNADGSLTLSYVQAEAPVENSPDIKWQVTSGTNASSTSTNLRLLTWVDSPANYSSVTFNVTINGKTSKLVSTTAYTAILASGVAIRNPANIFKNDSANYFVTYTLKNIPSSYFDIPIVVTVTWKDLNGNETTSESKTILISSDWA